MRVQFFLVLLLFFLATQGWGTSSILPGYELALSQLRNLYTLETIKAAYDAGRKIKLSWNPTGDCLPEIVSGPPVVEGIVIRIENFTPTLSLVVLGSESSKADVSVPLHLITDAQ